MTAQPITYISIALGPKVGANDAIVGVRVVPDGRVGNEVYGVTGRRPTGGGFLMPYVAEMHWKGTDGTTVN